MNLLWDYLKRHKKILVGALVLAAINQIFSLLDPQIFRILIDRYASNYQNLSREEFMQGVILLLLASMGVAFVSRVAKNFQNYYVSVITQRVGARLYGDSVAHSFSLPYAVFEDQRSGELLGKLQKARTDSQGLISSAINVLFLSLIGILFVLAYAVFVHWSIALTYFLVIPIMGGTIFLISRRIKEAQKRIVKETAELAGSTTETLRNVELVKSLGLESQESKRLNEVNEKILDLELKKVKMVRKLSFLQGTLVNAVRSAVLFLMLYLIFQGTITLGEFFSLLFYSFFIFEPLNELGALATSYQEARASMETVQTILQTPAERKPDNPKEVGPLQSIEFKKVEFKYGASNDPAVKDINLVIRGGETAAFVGPSGSGKTTLVKLLVGLYRPTKGELLINRTPSPEIDYDELRKRIGYVSQETQLFAGTIRENLLFVNPDATDDAILNALRQASVTSILERGGKGLDTKIGEGGIKVSGGERQRLAIARALLRNPEMIIFDEATSSLDSITEKEITETIKKIVEARPNLITVLVAHRLSTVAHADKIFVLEKGGVVETGTSEKLLQIPGLFAALWREQQAEKERVA